MKTMVILCAWSVMCLGQVDESLTVSVKEMRVHVVDKKGNPVKGLTHSDFSLKVSRKTNDISFFEEVDLTTRNDQLPNTERLIEEKAFGISDTQRERNIVLFVDSSLLTKPAFEKVKQTVRDFIQNSLQASDKVKIIHWDEEFKHLTGFTKNRDRSLQALEQMPFTGIMTRKMKSSQTVIFDGIKDWADAPAHLKPSYHPLINRLIKEKGRLKALHYQTFFFNMLGLGTMLETVQGHKSIFLFTGGSYLESSASYENTSNMSERLGRALNRANTTIYTVLIKNPKPVGGQLGITDGLPYSFTKELDAISKFPPGRDSSLEIADNTISENSFQIESGPSEAAKSTGGLFLKSISAKDISEKLAKAYSASKHYYRIAFPSDNLKKNFKVKLKLKEKKRGWKLLYGKKFEVKKPYLDLSEEEREISLSTMLLHGTHYRDDLALDWELKTFSNGKEGFRTAFLAKFNEWESLSKGLEMAFVTLDEKRELIDMTSSTVAKLPTKKMVSFYNVLLGKKEPRFFRIYVRNLKTGAYSFLEKQSSAQASDNEPAIKGLTLNQSDQTITLPLNQLSAVKAGKGQASPKVLERSKADPYRMGSNIYEPTVAPYQFKPGILGYLFHLERPALAEDKSYDIQFVIESNGLFEAISGKCIAHWVDEAGSIHFQGLIMAEKLRKGEFVLHVRLVHVTSEQAFTTQVPLTLF